MKPETQQTLEALDAGGQADHSLYAGILRSSKTIEKHDDDFYVVTHEINFCQSYFSRDGIIEMLEGERDIWDGDLGGWNDEEQREFGPDGTWVD